MSKILKKSEKEVNSKITQNRDEIFAYRSVIISAILSGIFFIGSLFFNLKIITVFLNQSLLWNLLNILIGTILILLFFFFMIVSLGNYKELVGNPISWKEILLIILFSLGQSILNLWVFILSFLGIIFILIYFLLVQEI